MNLTDTVDRLLRDCQSVEVGKTPEDKDVFYVRVRQFVTTGTGKANFTELVHQMTNPSLVTCLDRMKALVDHATEMGIK